MSRAEIEPLLNLIFTEKGIVNIILSFDDSALDVLRKIVNPLSHLFTRADLRMCPHCPRNNITEINFHSDSVCIVKCLESFHIAFQMDNPEQAYLDFFFPNKIEFDNGKPPSKVLSEKECLRRFSYYFQRLQQQIKKNHGLIVMHI